MHEAFRSIELLASFHIERTYSRSFAVCAFEKFVRIFCTMLGTKTLRFVLMSGSVIGGTAISAFSTFIMHSSTEEK